MALHLIPAGEPGTPDADWHAPTSECGCGPAYGWVDWLYREAYIHQPLNAPEPAHDTTSPPE